MALISRVTLRNYKSIASCRVDLQPLTFLVGPNGSGKSNFLDSLRFVSDALSTTLDHAVRNRGSLTDIHGRESEPAFEIGLDLKLPSGPAAHYAFRLEAKAAGGFEVKHEACKVFANGPGTSEASYQVTGSQVVASTDTVMPVAAPDRLYLVAASGLPAFRPVYDALSRLCFYNLSARQIAAMQKPDSGERLYRQGGNSASVFAKLPPAAKQEIVEYLGRIVPGIQGVETKTFGSHETLEFRQSTGRQDHPWRFLAASMSDGTLRAFGVLLALLQGRGKNGQAPPVIGLEEPEIALHPAASGVLLGALREASHLAQILVTSHSPDLLDDPDIPDEDILAVENRDGVTAIGPVDEAGRSAIKDRLFTPGELLRQNQLSPAPELFEEDHAEQQLNLFDPPG